MPFSESVGPKMIAFRGVVVDDIENHFEPRRVQGLHHGLEFADRIGRKVTRLERKKSDGVVAPVISQAAFDELAIVDKAVHRHEFDRGHSQPRQVFDDRSGRQARIGSAQMRGNVRMAHGESLHVQFINQGFVPGNSWRRVRSPGECGINHAILWHAGGIVAPVKG